MIEKESVKKICIDDFALKKSERYGTVMVDIETGHIVDMLESRETAEVTEWLKTYPNIEVASRDGSITYKKALEDSHPEAEQVSDRFHLLKGLTDAVKGYITGLLGANFRIKAIERNGNCAKDEEGYFKTKEELPADLPERQHKASTEKKQAVVDRVRELAGAGYKTNAITKEIGLSYVTVKKYSNPNYNPASVIYGVSLDSKLKAYTDEINEMLRKGYTFKEIEQAIRQKGYNGAVSTIRMYATRERRLMKQAVEKSFENTELIERKWLLNLLYRPLEKVKQITQEQLARIISEYPIIGKIYDIVGSFKEILFSKKADDIDSWLTEAALLGIDDVNSFIVGTSRDIDAVKNAILLDYSNGLAEGSVNKLKVIKRIMYGRCSFALLRSKTLRLEAYHSFN